MSDLRRRMLEDLQLGGYSAATVESYVRAVAAFAKVDLVKVDAL